MAELQETQPSSSEDVKWCARLKEVETSGLVGSGGSKAFVMARDHQYDTGRPSKQFACFNTEKSGLDFIQYGGRDVHAYEVLSEKFSHLFEGSTGRLIPH